MTVTLREPGLVALVAVAQLLRGVRVRPAAVAAQSEGAEPFVTELALPTDADYGSVPAGAALLKRVDAGTTLGIVADQEALPRAWVFTDEAELVGGGASGLHRDRELATALIVHVKAIDPGHLGPAAAEARLAFQQRLVDFARRLTLALPDGGVTNAQLLVGEWTVTYSADGREQHFDLPIVLDHYAQQTADQAMTP